MFPVILDRKLIKTYFFHYIVVIITAASSVRMTIPPPPPSEILGLAISYGTVKKSIIFNNFYYTVILGTCTIVNLQVYILI